MTFATITLLAFLAFQEQYKIEGWPIKKSWGPVRSAYFDPLVRELRMVFEDTAGTVRIVKIDPKAETAVPIVEMQRQ